MKERESQIVEINGVCYSVCKYCNQPVRYPDGLNLRGGREVHLACWQGRMRKAGQDLVGQVGV